jgi:hypothetical protein
VNGLAVSPASNNQSIFNLDFESGRNQSIINLDFERQNVSISPKASSHFRSVIYDNESSSLVTTRPIIGTNSLRVDVKPSNDTTKWNTISTDFIPVNENARNNFSLALSAKDVNQLHSKVNYFDSNKKEIKSVLISGGRSGTFETLYTITDYSPNGTKYIQLQILSKSNSNMSSSYLIDNAKIENVPFKNNKKVILSISTEKNKPILGNNSLRVEIKPGNTTKWNTISTYFIPVNENAYYNTSLYISAKDVNQLHSKVNYYDSNKKEIKSVFISGGRDGTFEVPYNITDSSPNGTKYIQLEILAKSNPKMPSSYLIDNVKIENVPFGQLGITNNNKDILSISTEKNKPISGNNSLRVDIRPGYDTTNMTDWITISTDFIPVNENADYNFSLALSAKDVNQLHSKVNYFDSNKKEIKSAFISGGRDGTFEAPYNITDSSPNGTKYMQLHVWVKSNPVKSSSFLLDNIMIKKIGN